MLTESCISSAASSNVRPLKICLFLHLNAVRFRSMQLCIDMYRRFGKCVGIIGPPDGLFNDHQGSGGFGGDAPTDGTGASGGDLGGTGGSAANTTFAGSIAAQAAAVS